MCDVKRGGAPAPVSKNEFEAALVELEAGGWRLVERTGKGHVKYLALRAARGALDPEAFTAVSELAGA